MRPTFYGIAATLLRPLASWGRLRVEGLEHVPTEGPVLLVPNHDSQMDPVLLGLALRRVRPVRFLARANLWQIPLLGRALDALGQIPIERGAGDAGAIRHAVDALRAGEAVCIFPEGRLSNGRTLRARSGVARLAAAAPEARVVLCAIAGSTGYARFPRPPRVTISFFQPVEEHASAQRLLSQVRAVVPPAPRRARLEPIPGGRSRREPIGG